MGGWGRSKMTRGHQRDVARAKNAAKNKTNVNDSAANKGLTPQQRAERDAAALAAKKAAKMEKANSSAAEQAKHAAAEERKRAKQARDKENKATKKNPLIAKQNAKCTQ